MEEDLQLVNLFRGQAKNANNDLDFSDHSVKEPFDSTNAEYVRRQIAEKINRASVTLCLLGSSTYTSRWVSWEIEKSHDLKKGLVAVNLTGKPITIPSKLSSYGITVLSWDLSQINQAIERAARSAGY